MGHHTYNIERLEIENGELVRIIEAQWKNYKLDVYKEYLDSGKVLRRNMEFTYLAGWVVYFPGEIYKIPYSSYRDVKGLEEWWESGTRGFNHSEHIPFDKERIIELYPDLKYLIKKCDFPTHELLFDAIRHYRQYPNTETLFAMGYWNIALNKNLQRARKERLNKIINFIKNNKVNNWTRLKDIEYCIKHKITYSQMSNHIACGSDTELFKYLTRKNQSHAFYIDYKTMCIKAGHDFNDPYWKYPNDLVKAHDKVMKETFNIEAAKNIVLNGLLEKSTKHLQKFNRMINGYYCFIPNDMVQIVQQSKELSQCLVSKGYVKQLINQEETLVFIWKNDKSCATAQIFYEPDYELGQPQYEYRVGQFYADEKDHKTLGTASCIPNDELKAVLKEFLKTYKPKRIKFEYKQKFYKGFQKMDGDAFVGFANYHFRIGETYETAYEDSEIIAAGGSGCSASNKVFHFCANLPEIFNHYNPDEGLFCEVEPLGALVEYNGAYLSNKIKIIRQLTIEEINQAMVNKDYQYTGL